MDSATPITSTGSERPPLRRPFGVHWADGELTLVAAPDLNERSWAAWFGDLQAGLDERQWDGQAIETCVVDLQPCLWADPLPLLSLALSLANFEARDGKVRLLLPEHCERQDGPRPADSEPADQPTDCKERGRLLKFMAREGFLDLLAWVQPVTSLDGALQRSAQARDIRIGTRKFTAQDIPALRDLRAPLAFEESTCVPAVLLALGMDASADLSVTLEAIDGWVRRTIETRVNPVVTDKVPAWAQRGLLYRLQILLRETLHNIVEHAYGTGGGLAAVYVRYREGRLGQAPSAWGKLNPHIAREDDMNRVALMRAVPTYQSFARTRAGFFEVFVLDGGRGLIKQLAQIEELRDIRERANPLHRAMLEVFNGRSTKKKKERHTELGGLYLLRRLLEPSHDYLRTRDEDGWWGQELPLPVSDSQRLMGRVTINCDAAGNATPIQGLAWTARLSWLDRMDSGGLPEVGTWRAITLEDRRPLLAVLRGDGPATLAPPSAVDDWRQTGLVWQSQASDQGAGVLLVLPHRDWMKDRIQHCLRESLQAKSLRPPGTLVVGDVVCEEALTYLLAIRRARGLLKEVADPPERIILVTRDLRSLVLRLRGGQYEEDPASTGAFVRGTAPWSLADYFRTLRAHDGERLWKTIDDGKDGPLAAFRREWVDWHDGRCLDGYLDFPATLTNPVCRAIYNLTLERLTALFPRRDCRLIPLDNLVDSLVVRFRAQQRPRGPLSAGLTRAETIDIHVGSVRVTGLTQQARTVPDEHPTVFHFFGHPSGNTWGATGDGSMGYYLLPWLGAMRGAPPQDCTGKHQPPDSYRRIGRTPGIARGGWKAFRLPRFNEGGVSLYEATPHETYVAWQDPSRTPMKLGHWSYGGHHDLLTVNLLLAFDTELDQISLLLGGRLARFVYANLFRALGITRHHLNHDGQRLWDTIRKDAFRRLIPRDVGARDGILVFPSHPVTDHVLARLTGWLHGQGNGTVLAKDPPPADMLARCVPILPLRRHRGGSGLQLSGLTIERLQSFGTEDNRPPVTFFDDAMISGDTFRQMKSLLHGLGFHRVYSLTMLDRQRLPSAHHIDREVHKGITVQTLAPDSASTDDQSFHSHTAQPGNSIGPEWVPNGQDRPVYKNVSYWRLDAPAMGSRAHCPLCKGLGRVKDLAGGIESPERRARALEWLGAWAERNPATDWGDAGLRPIPLDLKKPNRKFGILPDPDYHPDHADPDHPSPWKQAGTDGKEIMLTNSAGLVAWVTELYSITSRDDLALKRFGEDVPDSTADSERERLDPETRIQLFATQLLLFHGEFDRDTAEQLGWQLALALFKAPTHDRNTALAALTLIACGNRLLTAVLARFKSMGLSGDIVTDQATNLDFLTLLELSRVMEIRSGLRPSPALLSAASRRETYRLLQQTICSGEPDHHSSPFSRFQTVSSPPTSADHSIMERLVEASVSLRRRLHEISPDWFQYHDKSAPLLKLFPDIRKSMERRLDKLAIAVGKALAPPSRETSSDLDLTACKAWARDLLSDGQHITLALFTPLGLASLREERRPLFLDELQKAVDVACKNDRLILVLAPTRYDCRLAFGSLDVGKAEYYVIWDSLIRNALDRILSNVRHADPDPTPCLWGQASGVWPDEQSDDPAAAPTAHLWVRIEIQEKWLAILLRNHTDKDARYVTNATSGKDWIATFKELGGDVIFSNPEGNRILETRIQIPYSFFLTPPPQAASGADHDAI